MADASVPYFLEGVIVLGAFAAVTSCCGLPVVSPLFAAAGNRSHRLRFLAVDFFSLAVVIVISVGSIWSIYPTGDKLDAVIHIISSCIIAATWWGVVVLALSGLDLRSMRRVVYQIAVIPIAFVAPLVIAMDVFIILQSQNIRPPSSITTHIVRIFFWLLAYLSLFTLTAWIRRSP